MQHPPRIIICGAPASGKGTQCEFIKEHFKVVHLSTGDILRAAVDAGNDLGIEAKKYMDKGELVPDSLMINLILARLKEND
jgi:adenylate kinase